MEVLDPNEMEKSTVYPCLITTVPNGPVEYCFPDFNIAVQGEDDKRAWINLNLIMAEVVSQLLAFGYELPKPSDIEDLRPGPHQKTEPIEICYSRPKEAAKEKTKGKNYDAA